MRSPIADRWSAARRAAAPTSRARDARELQRQQAWRTRPAGANTLKAEEGTGPVNARLDAEEDGRFDVAARGRGRGRRRRRPLGRQRRTAPDAPRLSRTASAASGWSRRSRTSSCRWSSPASPTRRTWSMTLRTEYRRSRRRCVRRRTAACRSTCSRQHVPQMQASPDLDLLARGGPARGRAAETEQAIGIVMKAEEPVSSRRRTPTSAGSSTRWPSGRTRLALPWPRAVPTGAALSRGGADRLAVGRAQGRRRPKSGEI